MGRGKHCTNIQRYLILKFLKSGKTYKFIQETLGCSAKMIINAKKWKPRQERRGGKIKTTPLQDRDIIICVKRSPFMTSTQIKQELDLPISSSAIRRRLILANLRARRPRKVPLLNSKQVKKRLAFAREHKMWLSSKWRNILWTDEAKVSLINSYILQQRVRRPPCTAFLPRYTTKTIKHGGVSVMVWGSFSWYGVGPIYWIKEIMDLNVYIDILQNTMLPFAEEDMPLKWVLMQDNDPKHTSRTTQQWLQENKIDVMVWPPQSPDLNPIENLWADVKKVVATAKPKNKDQLWEAIQSAWKAIPITRCKRLVESLPRRCREVLKNKGYATKY